MEPISLILAALVAGATAATKETAGTAVKDAYEALKGLLKKKFAEQGKTDSSAILDKYEQKPEITKALLEDELVEAGLKELKENDPIIKEAQKIMKKEDPEGTTAGKYNINAGRDIKAIIFRDMSGGEINQTIN
jgi:hypothetical protein